MNISFKDIHFIHKFDPMSKDVVKPCLECGKLKLQSTSIEGLHTISYFFFAVVIGALFIMNPETITPEQGLHIVTILYVGILLWGVPWAISSLSVYLKIRKRKGLEKFKRKAKYLMLYMNIVGFGMVGILSVVFLDFYFFINYEIEIFGNLI